MNSFAATLASSDEGLIKVGTVSATGAYTLSGLERSLAKKAEQSGASKYHIIFAGGESKLYGVAVTYE